jgi:hypothetical protein
MKKYIFLLSLFLLLPSIVYADVDPQKMYGLGMEAYSSEKYEKAIELFEKAIDAGLSGDKLKIAKIKISDANNALIIPPKEREALNALYGKLKKVVLNKNINVFKKMFHPSCLECITEAEIQSTIDSYINIFNKNIKLEKVEIISYQDPALENLPEEIKNCVDKRCSPVSPEYNVLISIEYSSGGAGFSVSVKKHDGDWKLVTLCMKEEYRNIETVESENAKPHDSAGNINISYEAESYRFVQTDQAGRVFVIAGKVKNDYSMPRSYIQMSGSLYTNGKTLAATASAYCGNVISDMELSQMTPASIKTRMENRLGDSNRNVGVSPGEERPFMIVFFDLPENIDEFTIAVLGSSESENSL